MRQLLRACLLLLLSSTVLLSLPPGQVAATPVALDDATYLAYGRVFPDPHGCVKGQPGKSPYAKGNVCATQFIQFNELVAGLQFLDSKFEPFMELYEIPNASAGLPTSTIERQKHSLYAVRVTNEQVTGEKKKFAFSLSIHGIERAGAEGGTRAIEDLVTWATHEPNRGLLEETLPGKSAITVGQALAQAELWFFYPNADGWVRGDVTSGGPSYQRYNGNGMDVNRDWPTQGYTFRPYTPGSEPETKAFTQFFKNGPAAGGQWAGSTDLHGMLDATAFTYTMLPAGEYDYARNQAIVALARRIQEDANPRLAWFFQHIQQIEQELGEQIQEPTGNVSLPKTAQQWGTTWDTIEYTITGGVGDWLANPLGLNAYVGMNNEMFLSHLAPNNVFVPDLEQAHIDGNKGLIFAQVEGAFRASDRDFALNGRLAYIDHGRRFTNPGAPTTENLYQDLPPQTDEGGNVTSPTQDGSDPVYNFKVLGPNEGVYNGGLTLNVTYTNLQGVATADLTTAVVVERSGNAHGEKEWEEVARNFNQDQLYAAAGHTVNVNTALPGDYRVRLEHGNDAPGTHHIDIDFTSGQSWPDPGQAPYDVSSVKFFEDLNKYLPADKQVTRLTPQQIAAGADLAGFDTIVAVNDALPGWYDPQPTGDAQPSISHTFPPIADEVTYEWELLPEFNSQSMEVAISWQVPSDHDLYVERQSPSGTWVELGSSTAFINTREATTISNMFPGRYRARVVNFAAAPQPVDLAVGFSNQAAILPPEYQVDKTPAQRDAYFARLREFVSSGGNLVLTDGAARNLPHLGFGAPRDVKPLTVYSPYVGFTVDGETNTYGDPLAANVNQPGAAEGAGSRHQTVEIVPLGYAIQDANGDDLNASFNWIVNPDVYSNAGGRVVGTAAGGVMLGEIPLGDGVIRQLGALLPDPEVRYEHPYGLVNYALTYTGWQLFENLVQWQRPRPDLALSAGDIALSVQRVTGGDRVTITATVHNAGSLGVSNVAVLFTDNGTPIGTPQSIASIPAGGSGSASVVWDTRGKNGSHSLAVSADPANAIVELDEANNSASRSVTVRGNKVQNGSFEASSDGATPDGWTGSGVRAYELGGSDGERSVSAGPGGSWTSAPIAVEAGKTYGVSVSLAGAGGTLVVEQLDASGALLSSATELLSSANDGLFHTVTKSMTAANGVSAVRLKLSGGLTGVTTFDDARLWQE